MKRKPFYLFAIAALFFIAVVVLCGKKVIVLKDVTIELPDGWHEPEKLHLESLEIATARFIKIRDGK